MAQDFSKAEFIKSVQRADQAPRPERPSIVFAGRSNVGKSSLINSLLRRKGLAKTSSTPGRTREINYFSVDERCYFVDLPGYGYAKVPRHIQAQWRPMIEGFLTRIGGIRLVIIILDSRRDPSPEDLQLVAWFQSLGLPYQFVINKIDKIPKTRRARRLKEIAEGLGMAAAEGLIPYSSEDGTGRRELLQVLLHALEA